MKNIKDRAVLPKMDLIPREEREQQEIRYMGYLEKLYHREGGAYGK